jgi:hypothetical protein
MRMKRYKWLLSIATLAWCTTAMSPQEGKYSPLSEYLMPQDDEIALAKSAAPQVISDHATILVFTPSGYQTVHEGDNGFVCMVMRGFTGAPTFTPLQVRIFINYDPKTRAPICLNPAAVRTVLPYYELRTKLGLEGKTAEQIAAGVEAAYTKGEIPKRSEVSFGYMWSADQVLGPAGHWHPHMMVYLPYYENAMLGNNDPGSHLPAIGDDAGSPFAVGTIPVDDTLARKAKP